MSRRPDRPFDAAFRALARRDLTSAELDRRLERAGFSEAERDETLARLRSAGYVDDGRAACERARVLAGRGLGDAAIRFDLEGRGLAEQLRELALASLEPEAVRAERVARTFGGGSRAARALARKGFDAESISRALGVVADGP